MRLLALALLAVGARAQPALRGEPRTDPSGSPDGAGAAANGDAAVPRDAAGAMQS